MLDIKFFYEQIALLVGVYQKEMPKEIDKLYYELFKNEFSNESFSKAIQLHLKNPDSGRFYPKPCDLFKYLSNCNRTKALEAWELIIGDSYDREKAKKDPFINKAMRMIGGWDNFARAKVDDLPFRSRDFCEAYVLICEKNEREGFIDDKSRLTFIIENSKKITQ